MAKSCILDHSGLLNIFRAKLFAVARVNKAGFSKTIIMAFG